VDYAGGAGGSGSPAGIAGGGCSDGGGAPASSFAPLSRKLSTVRTSAKNGAVSVPETIVETKLFSRSTTGGEDARKDDLEAEIDQHREDDDAEDAPEIGAHQLEAPAEQLACALAVDHDRGNDHGPAGQRPRRSPGRSHRCGASDPPRTRSGQNRPVLTCRAASSSDMSCRTRARREPARLRRFCRLLPPRVRLAATGSKRIRIPYAPFPGTGWAVGPRAPATG
jgi:hypothetical protein